MFIKKITCIRTIAIVIGLCNLSIISLPLLARKNERKHIVEITALQLRSDLLSIKTYVTKKVADDLKKAKKWGKGVAKTFAGISSYTFDAIPFEFFTDFKAIDEAFKRLEQGVGYIQEAMEEYKKTLTGNKKKLNQSTLGEFLYRRVVARVTVTDAQRRSLEEDPLKMDAFVRSGIVKKDEYMYFTLLNFAVRYYLEHELKR